MRLNGAGLDANSGITYQGAFRFSRRVCSVLRTEHATPSHAGLWGRAEENGENRKTPVAISMAHDRALIYRTLRAGAKLGKLDQTKGEKAKGGGSPTSCPSRPLTEMGCQVEVANDSERGGPIKNAGFSTRFVPSLSLVISRQPRPS